MWQNKLRVALLADVAYFALLIELFVRLGELLLAERAT
jgi:hypothetical protein